MCNLWSKTTRRISFNTLINGFGTSGFLERDSRGHCLSVYFTCCVMYCYQTGKYYTKHALYCIVLQDLSENFVVCECVILRNQNHGL